MPFFVVTAFASAALAQDPPPPPAGPPPEVAPAAPPVVMVPGPPPPMMMGSQAGESPPSSGVGLLVTGAIFTGIGVLNLATAPICKTSVIQDNTQDLCLGLSLGIGGGFVAIGLPLLIVGGSKRSTYNEWKLQHPVASGFGVNVGKSGGNLGWSASF